MFAYLLGLHVYSAMIRTVLWLFQPDLLRLEKLTDICSLFKRDIIMQSEFFNIDIFRCRGLPLWVHVMMYTQKE